jgi:hypothetical protein
MTEFRESFKYKISLKFVQWEPSSMWTDRQMDGWRDGQTEMMKLIVALWKFMNVPKN